MSTRESDVSEARLLIDDLRLADPMAYGLAIVLPAVAGWTAFALAFWPGLTWPARALMLVLSAVLLYRAEAFVHEFFHQTALRRLRMVWHGLVGVPLLLPLLMYIGVHQGHHNARTYGTAADGEYERFQGRVVFMAAKLFGLNLVLPLALLVRFALLQPLAWLVPVVRSQVIPNFLHLALRIPFKVDEPTGAWRRECRVYETLAAFWAWGLLALAVVWRVDVLWSWALVLVVIATLNTCRALVSTHLYVEQNAGRNAAGQVEDSLNVDGHSPLTWLLCPAGLQFHALHHLAPYLPYHALPAAHRRLVDALPAGSFYRRATVSSPLEGWRRLRDAGTRAAGPDVSASA